MGGFAWVTLATNDSYSLGALVLAHSLKKVNTDHKLVVLITPSVSQGMREQMQTVFDQVKLVEVLDSKDEAHLALLKRPELGITFTKIHCWRLTEYDKCVFLDADTLVVKNCDELFEREELSAAPDFSWPDCFNSGVFVFKPSVETFDKILQFAVEKGSFDGGDQGLLNQFFADWATEDIKKHLPFVYNLSSLAAYSYIPAFKQYGSETRIVHFIGTGKPWLQKLDPATKSITPTPGAEHLGPMLQKWWDLFCEKVHPNLNKNLEVPNGMPQPTPVEVCSNSVAVEINHEPPKSCLVEPYAPYREKDDFRQFNLPYQPFDVKGSSGELLNVDFLVASVVPPAPEASWEEQQRQNEMDEKIEKVEMSESSETKEKDKQTESQEKINDSNREVNEEGKRGEDEKNIEKEEEKPPKGPYDYNSFFPDEKCISNYLDHNVIVYQPFDNHNNQHNHNHHHHDDGHPNEHNVEGSRVISSSHNSKNQNCSYHHDDDHPNEYNVEGNRVNSSSHNSRNQNCSYQEPAENTPSLPRFLTIPEDDKRQSGNIIQEEPRIHKEETSAHQHNEINGKKDFVEERKEAPGPFAPQENQQTVAEKTELKKSKSMTYLDVTKIGATFESELKSESSSWKSQPNVSTEIKKYSMPKLKPILPKQNYFHKTVPTSFSKVTFYTEFLMSSEYREPADLPKDKIGFMETHIKETRSKRTNFERNTKEKFGPLPYAVDVQKSTIPPKEKKIFLRPLDNYAETYDLRFCKRQQGNKPKPKESEDRKENNFLPTKSAKGKKSVFVKKRKSKESNGNKKNRKRNSKKSKEKKVEPKVLTPLNSPKEEVNGTTNSVEEILRRLWNFSKDYLHYFGEANRKDKSVLLEPIEKMESSLPLVNGTPLIYDEADRWNA